MLTGCEELQALNNAAVSSEKSASTAVVVPPPQITLQEAQTLETAGNLIDAVSAYKALATRPEQALAANMRLAAIYRKLERYADAVAALAAAHALSPDDESLTLQYAYGMIDNGEMEKAVALLDNLTAVNPKNANAYNAKGVAFDKSGNHAAAQELYQKALKITPNALSVRNNLAMSYILNNRVDKAIEVLEALNQSPESTQTIRQNLALAYGIKGDRAKALSLNLQDFPREKAEENLKFYEEYAQKLRINIQNEALSSMLPDANESAMMDDEDITTTLPTPAPAPSPEGAPTTAPTNPPVTYNFLGFEIRPEYTPKE